MINLKGMDTKFQVGSTEGGPLSDFACKIFSFLVAFLRNYVAWIETVISIDRYVSIMHPHNLHLRDKLIFQLPILTLIFIISLGAYFPFYYFSGLYILLEQNTNYTYCNVIDLTAQIWLPFYDLIISTGIPFIIMLFTTCRVGIHLVKNKKNIKSKKELKLFKILLGMNFFFFFFYLQWLIFQLVYQLSPPAPLNIIQIFQSWYTLSQFLNSTYCSVTFFIHYCCNKQFRKYFKSMLFNRVVKKQITFGTDRRSTTAFRLFSL